jgi:hypothetical protein
MHSIYVEMDKLSITNEMRCLDAKDREFYDSLTDEERKRFSNYLMLRWGSSVVGSRDLQEFYVISTNERLNKHYFAVNRHPKLQWLMATSISPGMGTQKHQWIPPRKKDKAKTGDVKKRLQEYFPTLKLSDIETLAKIVSPAELKQYDRDHGHKD